MKKYVFESLKFFCAAILCTILSAFTTPAHAALPSGYTELQYIESTGTQYIDTGIKNIVNAEFGIVAQQTELLSGFPTIFGANDASDKYKVIFGYGSSGSFYTQGGDSRGYIASSLGNDTNKHTFVIKNTASSQELTIDNQTVSGNYAITSSTTYPLYMFARNTYGTATAFTKQKVWSFYAKNNGSFTHNFVPAKNSSGVVGMYDTVGNRFYTNAGTGEFIAGPDACNGTIVNYTSATGTVSQAGTPTPTNPIEPTFYKQGNMVLRKVDDYADSYDATTGKITRRVGKYAITGNEDWVYLSSSKKVFTVMVSDALLWKSQSGCLSNAFACTNGIPSNFNLTALYLHDSVSRLYMGFPEYDNNVNGFKQWLRDQYANGTPVTIYYPLETETTEDWPASYCETPIKIATTKYNETAFGPLNTALQNAISVVDTVVSNTITQAASIATLQAQKQTRPADDTCPAYKQCLLVEDENGAPHWYEITDPFRDFVAPIIANNVAPASTTNQPGFTQLEYIESTRTQYIDTGYQNDQGIVIDTKLTFVNTAAQAFFGSHPSNGYGEIQMSIDNGNINVGFGGGNVRTSTAVSSGATHTYEYSLVSGAYYLKQDGTTIYTADSGNYVTRDNLVLFALTANSNLSLPATVKMYYFRIRNTNNTLVRNFIPAKRNSDGAIGMYDTVSKTFFANAGTGTFTAGPNVANTDVPANGTWTATWTANATTGVTAGTITGEALCNGVSSSQSVVATSAQMSSANWDVDGVNCWCHMTVLDNGNIISTTNDSSYVFHSTSGTNSACMTNCASFCERTIRDYAGFRNPVLQM